jgi:single-stranded DNA-binding protein
VLVLGKHAKRIAPDLYRGCRVVLEGRLEHTSWEAHDGSERESVCVIAVRVQPLDARSADARSAQAEPAVDPSSGSTGRRAAVRGLS